MKRIFLCFAAIFALSSSAIGNEKTIAIDSPAILYDIILDIGIEDREAYYAIMNALFDKNIPGIAVHIMTDDANGIVDYAVPVAITNKNLNIINRYFFTGSFKYDHSDINKLHLNRKPLITQEQYRDLLMR